VNTSTLTPEQALLVQGAVQQHINNSNKPEDVVALTASCTEAYKLLIPYQKECLTYVNQTLRKWGAARLLKVDRDTKHEVFGDIAIKVLQDRWSLGQLFEQSPEAFRKELKKISHQCANAALYQLDKRRTHETNLDAHLREQEASRPAAARSGLKKGRQIHFPCPEENPAPAKKPRKVKSSKKPAKPATEFTIADRAEGLLKLLLAGEDRPRSEIVTVAGRCNPPITMYSLEKAASSLGIAHTSDVWRLPKLYQDDALDLQDRLNESEIEFPV
jgi:hypothetical protein